MVKTFFITGTDTDVGKTVVTAALLQKIANKGQLKVAGYKPIASGANYNKLSGAFENSDAITLQNHSSINLDYLDVNPYCFNQATAPHIASNINNHPIKKSVIDRHFQKLQKRADLILIEGAGGWFTPISSQTLISDWVTQHQFPVILVVDIKLGCINHAMLTQLAIQQAGLKLYGWAANSRAPLGEYYKPYLQTLRHQIKAPLLAEIPYLSHLTIDKVTGYIKTDWQNL